MAAAPGGHEQALADRGVRKELGAYYTPPDVVEGLLSLVLDPLLADRSAGGVDEVAALRILDPACGTGNFLVAAAQRIARRLEALGLAPDAAAARAVRCVRGVEIDGGTARRCRADLRAVHPDGGGRTIVRGDALLDAGLVRPGSFDLVIGNPPFLNQLAASTARSRPEGAALRSRYGPAVGPYTDPAAVFLLAALQAARPDGGVVCLIEPVSLLSGRDGRAVRAAALDGASLRQLWVAEQPVFDAEVEVCAPVLVRGGGSAATELVRGRTFTAGPVVPAPEPTAPSWSGLLAALQDLPDAELHTHGVIGDLADATADFRDQYYGLADAVVDQVAPAAGLHPLVTSGLIDPARLHWGERPCRFNKAPYLHPRVELARLSVPLQGWAERRLVPKVLVATQTRVLEAIVDPAGDLLPSVPVVTVTARSGEEDDLWRIAALLCSPPVTLVAARRHLGAARNATALRLSASDVVDLPLPVDRSAWDRGAAAFRSASETDDPEIHRQLLLRSAGELLAAYGVLEGAMSAPGDLLAWWTDRLPQDRTPPARTPQGRTGQDPASGTPGAGVP